MDVVDTQVHVVYPNTPAFPWAEGFRVNDPLHSPLVIDAAEMLSAMDDAGVQTAIIVSTSHYGFDQTVLLHAAAVSNRLRAIARMNYRAPDIAEQVTRFASQEQAVAVRTFLYTDDDRAALDAGAYEPLLNSAAASGLPVCIYAPEFLHAIGKMADDHPDVQFVVDHLGLIAPGSDDDLESIRSASSAVCTLAVYPNIALKVSGAPAVSSQGFPFSDLSPPIEQLVEAFGIERAMWGSDWTRIHNGTYADNVGFLRGMQLWNEEELSRLMALNARRIFALDPSTSGRDAN